MRANWIRGLGLSLVLAITSLEVGAQRTNRDDEGPSNQPGEHSYCEAPGRRCLLGSAGGCHVACYRSRPVCEGATCFLGFPQGAICYCEGGNPT